MRTNELMLYKHMENGQILEDMTFLMDHYDNEYYNAEDLKGLLFEVVNELLEMTVSHGFEGNLWHNYLTYLLATHENAYSTSCEITGEVEGSINFAALHDFVIFKELFDYDFTSMEEELGADCLDMIRHYEGTSGHGKVFNKRIRDRICELSRHLARSASPEEFKEMVDHIRMIEKAVGKVTYDLTPKQKKSREHSRSLFVAQDMKAGDVFTPENLRSVRPSCGLHTRYYEELLGKRITRDARLGTPMDWSLVDFTEKEQQ